MDSNTVVTDCGIYYYYFFEKVNVIVNDCGINLNFLKCSVTAGLLFTHQFEHYFYFQNILIIFFSKKPKYVQNSI